MLDRLHLGAARCAKVFHRFTGSVGFAVSHGRLPDASRSHGRATDADFSSNTSLARAALIWSRIDISAAAGACSAARTLALDDKKRIAPTTKIFSINADSTITRCCPIYLRPQRGANNNDRLPRNAVDAVIVTRRLPCSLRRCARQRTLRSSCGPTDQQPFSATSLVLHHRSRLHKGHRSLAHGTPVCLRSAS